MKERPVHLNLLTIRFPITAIVSILHRISGVLLVLLLPGLLYVLKKSLHSESSFQMIQSYSHHFVCRWILWAALSALIYHVVAGLRHLIMDMGIGENKVTGHYTAYMVLGISVFFIAWLGFRLW